MTKAVFYHAGCPVCVSAEQAILNLVDPSRYAVEVIHLGETRDKIEEAKAAGVKSVPALHLQDTGVLHINFGANLSDI